MVLKVVKTMVYQLSQTYHLLVLKPPAAAAPALTTTIAASSVNRSRHLSRRLVQPLSPSIYRLHPRFIYGHNLSSDLFFILLLLLILLALIDLPLGVADPNVNPFWLPPSYSIFGYVSSSKAKVRTCCRLSLFLL